jgi:dipeptidyl aminopeptidase/acylaminoacyl peptidase
MARLTFGYKGKVNSMRDLICLAFCLLLFLGSAAQPTGKRPIRPEDVYRLKSVSNPKISPDGNWVLYQLSKADTVKDRFESRLYMVNTRGDETVQLTEQTTGAGMAAWSPDDRYISFLAKGKTDESNSQVYLMNRKGGEPIQLTNIKGEIQKYRWFPDGGSILLEIRESSTADTAKSKVRKPYEIDRYAFKDDSEGYLDNRKTHLYLFDLKSKKLDTLTRGPYNEEDAVIRPDGRMIAYVSNTTSDPDRNENTDIHLMDLQSRKSEALTNFKGANAMPRFSPDNQYIAYNQSTTESGFNMYDQNRLHLYHIASKTERILSDKLDRSINNAEWSPDSRYIYSIVEDDRKRNILRFDISNDTYRYVTDDTASYSALDIAKDGKMSVLFSDRYTPNEVWLLDTGGKKRLTHEADEFLAESRPAIVTGFECMSSDKNKVSGILFMADSNSRKLPLILFIHGGPVGQDEFGFDMTRQVYAGAGYAVAAVNYRGSSGRGMAYTKSISADWGNREVKDILAVADHLVRTGVADPARLAIAGWSYGGILTNYTIATDNRFKAAVSGAGSSLQFSMFGSDQYIRQYEEELGAPWKNPKKWMDLSYPFFRVGSIRTPTLFMASEDDFNVPVIGSEQMYQAFKSAGIPTELVIYPNQHHGLRVPSYIVHRHRRHLDWFGRYLK